MSSRTSHIILHTPDMQQEDWAVELRMLCLLPSRPWVSALQVAQRTEPVAVRLGTALELQLVQTVSVAWLMFAVVPTVLVWVALPHCCTLERTVDEWELVSGKHEMKQDEVIRTLPEKTKLVCHKNKI
jgi:hypothetical protein